MANLEDIKTILLESRQAWAAAHKELLSAVKTNKSTNTKAAEKMGRVGMPDMSGIMPQDMRQIFAGFQNTLKQIFGGTTLAKFESTLKQTLGHMVGSGAGNFFKQFSATAAGAAAASRSMYPGPPVNRLRNFNKILPGTDITNLVGNFPGRYGGKIFSGRGVVDINYANMRNRGMFGRQPTYAQYAQMVGFGYDAVNKKFTARKGENSDALMARVGKAIQGIAGIGVGPVITPSIKKILKNNRWVYPDADELDHPAFDDKRKGFPRKYFSNRYPSMGKIADRFKQVRDTFFNRPLNIPKGAGWFGKMNPAVAQALGRIPGSGLAGNLFSATIGKTSRLGPAITAFGSTVGGATLAKYTAMRAAGATALRAGTMAAGVGARTAVTTGLAAAGVAAGLTNPIGWAIAIATAIPAIAGFTELLYKSQDGLRHFSGGMATVFAKSELNKLKRNITSSGRRAMVAGWLQTQSDSLKDKLLIIWDGLFIIVGSILAGLMWIINLVAGIYNILKGIWDWIKSWFIKDTKNDLGPLGNTLREFGAGRSDSLRAMKLFDWGGV